MIGRWCWVPYKTFWYLWHSKYTHLDHVHRLCGIVLPAMYIHTLTCPLITPLDCIICSLYLINFVLTLLSGLYVRVFAIYLCSTINKWWNWNYFHLVWFDFKTFFILLKCNTWGFSTFPLLVNIIPFAICHHHPLIILLSSFSSSRNTHR